MALPLTFEEIGEIEGISPETAKDIFNRAMQKLSRRMPPAYHRQGMRAMRELRDAGNEPDGFSVSRPGKKAA